KRFEREIYSTQLGIDNAGDFALALLHLYFAYPWHGSEPSTAYNSISDILFGRTTITDLKIHKDCVEHLSSVCDEINLDPARLIRLLLELIRADINHNPQCRRPGLLLDLLKHGELHLSSKDLRPFAPSCRRLIRYIRVSYKQFEDSWDEVVNQEYADEDDDPRPYYEEETRQELKTAYERFINLLSQAVMWKGEGKDISWPRGLLRPTGTPHKPFDDDAKENLDLHRLPGHNDIENVEDDLEQEVLVHGSQPSESKSREESVMVEGAAE
ncbi:hypothetical protein FRC17_004141, partial [Serendipita sp. 399]